MPTEKRLRAVVPDGTRLDASRDTAGAYRGTLRDENNRLVGHAELYEVEESDEYASAYEGDSPDDGSGDEDFGLGGAIAGLALVGLTLGAVAAVSAVRDKKARRQSAKQQASAAVSQQSVNPPAGWYDAGPGWQRWWDGQKWTDHYQSDPRHSPAPPGWYDDGSGRQRWWDGLEWTAHFQSHRSHIDSTSPVNSGHTLEQASRDVLNAPDLPQITMTSDEWQARVRAMLLARAISEQQWRLLSRARIEDGGHELLQWQQQLASLTPEQFSRQLDIALDADHELAAATSYAAEAGWYDDGSGQDRWWNGSSWTEHYRLDAVAVRAPARVGVPAGLYDDGLGSHRWWNGQSWA